MVTLSLKTDWCNFHERELVITIASYSSGPFSLLVSHALIWPFDLSSFYQATQLLPKSQQDANIILLDIGASRTPSQNKYLFCINYPVSGIPLFIFNYVHIFGGVVLFCLDLTTGPLDWEEQEASFITLRRQTTMGKKPE